MFIKSISIDGFKSYGKKVDIVGFDKLFNAITGLNGSGKSNILDAICFVLGLSNMSLARVSNLRELIFKAGQTGVTKASVSIIFDNIEKSQSPIGYEKFDEIVIRREVNMNSRTKYFVNGFSVTNTQVSDLFHTVHLNINNPHFLIMQGRITKVLNMKPHEILAMVEEATGVSMYEAKKKTAQSTIEKKDTALRDIDMLINETIVPKLEQLKKEQKGLLEFQNISTQYEHLRKISIAYQFYEHKKNVDNSGTKIEEQKNSISDAEKRIADIEDKINQFTRKMAEIEKLKDEELGGRLKELEEKLKQVQMEEAKMVVELNQTKDSLKEEEKLLKNFKKQLTEDTNTINNKKNEYEKLKNKFDDLENQRLKDETKLVQAQKDFEAISAGLSRAAEGEAAATLADQLLQAKQEISECETNIKKIEMKLKHCREQLRLKESEAKKHAGRHDESTNTIESLEKEVNGLENEIKKINFDEEKRKIYLGEREGAKNNLNLLKDEIFEYERRVHQSKFTYEKPSPNFDSSKVLGVVSTLFHVKDPATFLALETAAGGRLHNIVVDTENTAKLLLSSGQLRRQCTFLPLNKIRAGRDINEGVLKRAKSLVGEKGVDYALNLIDFDEDLYEVMKYIFSDTLVCENMDKAKVVAFHPSIKKKTVTLDGEVFDPAGTLSGGSSNKKGSLLADIAEINKLKNQESSLDRKLNEIETELKVMQASFQKHMKLKEKYDLKQHELKLTLERVKDTDKQRLLDDIKELKDLINDQEKLLVDNKEIKKRNEVKVNQLQDKVKNSKSVRERELKEAEADLNSAKKSSEKSRQAVTARKQEVESLFLEIQELTQSCDQIKTQIADHEVNNDEFKDQLSEALKKVEKAKEMVTKVSKELNEQKTLLKQQSEEINKLQKLKDSSIKSREEFRVRIKELEHEINKIEKDSHDAKRFVKGFLKKYPWIEEEKKLFGNENSQYNFDSPNFNVIDINRRINVLEKNKSELAKTVNMRANIMLTDKEKQSEEVTKKRKMIQNDKQNLIKYMEEVDKKKKDALDEAWEKINKDFGDIFSTLLPGTSAKLDKLRGKSVLDGLEVKVAFGGVWKESLTELSGGQRSLVALSLILALLLYNPAPLYILDEVDAALDQSHTQNIGMMIKKHFSQSQFIIVSLKDDMFNNANVLFKTKFVDGCSSVGRFARGGQ